MQSTHWKLGLLVSVLHVALFIAITYLGLQPLDHGAQSAKSSQVIELRSADPQKRVASRSIAEPSPSRALGVAQPSSVRGDAAFNHAIVAILHDINQAMQHFDRLILVKEGKIVGDHAAVLGAISDLADLYQIQLDAIERDGLPPCVFPRASLRLNTL